MEQLMACDRCDGQRMAVRKATPAKPYHYALSGLSNIYLAGIDVHTCPQCGGESPIIPAIGELHRRIAERIFDKPSSLKGEELRYLRKYAGLSAMKLAAILGVRPEHLSRAENDKAPLGEPTERFARALCIMAASDDKARAIFERMAEERTSARQKARTILVPDGRGWKTAA